MKNLVLALIGSTLLAACASLPGTPAADSLENRVDAYYAALVAKDYKTAYAHFSPGYRGKMSFENHYRTYPPAVGYRAARLVGKECTSDAACKVTVLVKVEFGKAIKELKGTEIETTVPESWVRIDGEWWMIPSR